ncbi:AT-rich interactive domain-containing protein 1B [Merluccius polli]|uniref:AT-rich interactive domain-containing protein 1B n=1 Tax=Merluccius polli TaxID=89951 RepID=A0AA47NQU6_MERPO|nr:AT-rich interactive domain-containing protein 1B [Merluccius polli]
MDTQGMLGNPKTRTHGGGGGEPPPSLRTPPHTHAFNQFAEHLLLHQHHQHHQHQNHHQNHNQRRSQHQGSGDRRHGGEEHRRPPLSDWSEEEAEEEDPPPPPRLNPEERMDGGYEHVRRGSTAHQHHNNNSTDPRSEDGPAAQFNHYYGNGGGGGRGEGGPCFDQHGGQQSLGSGTAQSTMDQVQNQNQNPHDGYGGPYHHQQQQQQQQHHYQNQNYRPSGYGGMASPARQGSNPVGPGGSNATAAASQSKAAMAAATASPGGGGGTGTGTAGFQRGFPADGPSQQQQQQQQQQHHHPSGATPTLNQLLTSPSPMMRGYGGGGYHHQDYSHPSSAGPQPNAGPGKMGEMGSQYGHGWGGGGGHSRPGHPAMSPGNNGQVGGRSQVPPMDAMAMKRSQLYGMSNNPYSQQQGAPHPGQPYGSPLPHRYPMGMSGRGQMTTMGGMQYPQQMASAGYSQQGIGGYSQPGQPPYYSSPQHQPAAPSQTPYMQPPAPLPQQEVPQEALGSRGQSAVTPGKTSQEDLGLNLQDRPSSLPDLSGSIDDLPTGTEAAISSAVSVSGSTGSNPAQSPFSPHVSPRLPTMRGGGASSSSPVASPVGSGQSRSGPISPASGPGTQAGPLTPGSVSQDVGPHASMGQSPMSQDRGFAHAMQRNAPGPQFGPQPSGPSMSPHGSPGGPMHHSSSYQQGGGPSYAQYGPPGNYPRPPHYGGAPTASYSGPGPGPANSMGMNASSPMHGQGPSAPSGRSLGPGGPGGRPYPGAANHMAPTSPGMPQPAGQGMGPLGPNGMRKPCETGPHAVPGANSASSSSQSRPPYPRSPAYPNHSWPPGAQPALSPTPRLPHPSPIPHSHPHPHFPQHHHHHRRHHHQQGMGPMGVMGPGGPFTQQPGNNCGRMTPQGPAYNVPPSGPMMMSPERMGSPPAKQRAELSRDGLAPNTTPTPASPTTTAEPPKPKKPGGGGPSMTGDKVARLYEMGGEPERRAWVDRYLAFMEDRGTPVPSLPTVGKKPLDLYRLYMCVREIGGVAMVNNNKKWRELAAHLTVGTSSSAASALKKHYTHFLFAYECKAERGEERPLEGAPAPAPAPGPGDPKKTSPPQARVLPPSPATSGPPQCPGTPQSSGRPETPGETKRPTPASTPHRPLTPQPGNSHPTVFHGKAGPGPSGAPYQPGPGVQADGLAMRMPYDGPPRKGAGPSEVYGPGQTPSGAMQDMYPRGPPSGPQPGMGAGPRPQYPYGPGYDCRPEHLLGPEGSLAPPAGQNNMTPSGNDPGLYPGNRYPPQRHSHEGYGQQQFPPSMPFTAHQPTMYPQQGYKRPGEGLYPPAKRHEGDLYPLQYGGPQPDVYGPYAGGGGGGVGYMGPERRPIPGQYPYPYPRDRIPPGAAQGPQKPGMMSGGPCPPVSGDAGDHGHMWPHRTDMGYSYPGRPGQGPPYPGRPGPQGPAYPGMGKGEDPEGRGPQDSQWPPGHRQPPFPPHASPSLSPSMDPMPSSRHPPSPYPASTTMANHVTRALSPSFLRPMGGSPSPNPVGPYLAALKKPGPYPGGPGQTLPLVQREFSFPPGAVEATQPRLKPRRRLTPKDTGTPEAWRVMMSLKSGLLAEGTWALDTLNILLYDDSTVGSFNLSQLPGLLELVVELYRRCLIQIFGILEEYELGSQGPQPTLPEPLGARPPAEETPQEPTTTKTTTAVCPPLSDGQSQQQDQSLPRKSTEKEKEIKEEEVVLLLPTEDPINRAVKREEEEEERGVCTETQPPVSAVQGNEGVEEKECTGGDEEPSEPPPPPPPPPKQASKYDQLPLLLEEKEEEAEEMEARWAQLNRAGRLTGGLLHWQAGGGDSTRHILTHMEPPGSGERGHAGPLEEEVEEEEEEMSEEDEEEGGRKKQTDVANELLDAQSGRWPISPLEDEPRGRAEAPLSTAEPWQDPLARRCVCVSNVLRSLSVVPGNDAEMSRHPGLVLLLGRLVLLHHRHPPRSRKRRRGRSQEEEEQGVGCSRDEWWWECLGALRENTLVTLANISGQLDLSLYPDTICLPLLDGLLHWMVCPSAEAHDPFPSSSSSLTPRRLALESLCKLSIQDANVDLLLATPPLRRQEQLFSALLRLVGDRRSPVCREMAVAALSNLAQGEASAARALALQKGSVGTLIGFLEDGVAVAQYHQNPPHPGGAPAPEPPSVNMMCRAAKALLALARLAGRPRRVRFAREPPAGRVAERRTRHARGRHLMRGAVQGQPLVMTHAPSVLSRVCSVCVCVSERERLTDGGTLDVYFLFKRKKR